MVFMVFTLGHSTHLRSLASGVGFGTISRSLGIVRFVQGCVPKTIVESKQVETPKAKPVKQESPFELQKRVKAKFYNGFVSRKDFKPYLQENYKAELIDDLTISQLNQLNAAYDSSKSGLKKDAS